MSTTPTNNPIPSESVKDLAFNAGKIDEFVNSPEEAFSDRFGLARLTLAGIQAEADNVIGALGFVPVDSFEAGATITSRNQSLHYLANNNYYRWDGALPKLVAASSTPASSGGEDAGAWVNVTDNTLRAQLASSGVDFLVDDSRVKIQLPFSGAAAQSLHDFSKVYVNVISFGADPSGVMDSTAAFQAAIDAVYLRGGGEVFIPATYGTGDGGNAGYKITSSIILKPFVNLRGEGFSSCLRTANTLTNGIITIAHHAGIGGRYINNIRLLGNNNGVAIGTDITAADTVAGYIYGWNLSGILCENFEWGFQLQGMWHSTIQNCTTSVCRVGLYFWGQNVSVHVAGCHFRRDGRTPTATRGIEITPRVYAWSSDQVNGSQSEAIIIDGETMCIGNEYGILVANGLDFHFSNLDLDFCLKAGVRVLAVNGTFTISDSWIAADSSGTDQFKGIELAQGDSLGAYVKRISGMTISATNASTASSNIGIDVGSGAKYVHIDSSTINGNIAIYLSQVSESSIENCKLEAPLSYVNGCFDVRVEGCSLNGISESGKPGSSFNYYSNNTGIPSTNGMLIVSVSGGATSATATIPNGGGSQFYLVTKLDRDVNASKDTLSVSGTTITLSRPASVTLPVGCYVEYRAI